MPLSGEPDGILKGYSPVLRLSLCWENEMLRFYDPESGDYLRNFEAERVRADSEQSARQEVVLQDPVDDTGEGLQLRLPGRRLPAVARRHGVGQHLAHGVPVQAKRPRSLLDAHPLHHHRPANPQIYVHLVHPSHHPWGRLQPYE